METEHTSHSNIVPRISGYGELFRELLLVAQELHQGDPVYDDACSVASMGWNLSTFDVSRCVLWISKGQDRSTCRNQFDSEIHTTSENSIEVVFHNGDFRSASVWLYFH